MGYQNAAGKLVCHQNPDGRPVYSLEQCSARQQMPDSAGERRYHECMGGCGKELNYTGFCNLCRRKLGKRVSKIDENPIRMSRQGTKGIHIKDE